MATPQLSPGVLVREVDLTVGRADNVLDNIGAIAGPFSIGPVDYPVDISTEQELINVFGKPISTDGQYEYWMSASSFLSYGGVLKVVRVDGDNLVNANAVRDLNGDSVVAENSLKIKNFDHYEADHAESASTYMFAAKTPGEWANNLKVCIIDDKADQIIGVDTGTYSFIASINNRSGSFVGSANTIGITTTGISLGQVVNAPGVVSYGTTVIGISTLNYITISSDILLEEDGTSVFDFGTITSTGVVQVGYAITTPLNNIASAGIGSTTLFNGYLKGIITGVDQDTVDVKIISIVDNNDVETPVSYAERSQLRSFRPGNVVSISTSTGPAVATHTLGTSDDIVLDWYDQQTLNLTNSTIYWKSIAPKPVTNEYVAERNGLNDAIHVVVIDDTGSVTGIQGNILEKHLGLSKAFDAISRVNSPQKIWYKNFLAVASNYIYAGLNPSDNTTPEEPVYVSGFSDGLTPNQDSDGLWGQNAQDVSFNLIGNVTYNLDGGKNYNSSGGYETDLGKIFNAYSLFSNRDEIQVDYLIMGPGFATKTESQAKANHLISIAELRRDCIAVISPHRDDVVDVPNSDTQTNNVIEFFSSLSPNGDQGGVRSSSYAVFDSGYKYTYDRFNNRFRYIPCNPDVAGLMVRTSILAYPWFSPAGQQRGVLNNAIKLAYNPSKSQRDRLYPQRVNAIINQPGNGVLLFGDKTALGYASAFDRINVRRLFLTVEQALEKTAQAQLFELNDEITRANFINIVEPYLRDIQAKRGVYDFLVVCDESNNTPDIIDNNEFRADIYLKPTKSINYVTLTFVATRTGVSFEEVAGRV